MAGLPVVKGTQWDGAQAARVVNREVTQVIVAMTQDARQAVSRNSEEDSSENPCLRELRVLRRKVFTWQDWASVKPTEYLTPLLNVIGSEKTSAPVMCVALSAVQRVLRFELFDEKTAGAAEAMHSIVDAVTGCKSKAADEASEEFVLISTVQVLGACLECAACPLLSNSDVIEIMNTCLQVAFTKGERLQRMSCQTMQDMVRVLFARLPELGPAKDAQHGRRVIAWKKAVYSMPAPSDPLDASPYDLICLVEVLRLLCGLILLKDEADDIEDRTTFGLALMVAAVDAAGASLEKHPRMLALVLGLFSCLFQAGQSNDLLALSAVSDFVLALYQHLKHHLKLQMAAFVELVVSRAAQGPQEQQEAALEILQSFCRQPSFIVDLYANADCDITCSNTFEDLSNLLSKKAFPVTVPLSSIHLLSLEGLLAIIQCMADRADNASTKAGSTSSNPDYSLEDSPFLNDKRGNWKDDAALVSFLRKRKYVKQRLTFGVDHFNRDPKQGLEFLQEVHLLPQKLDPECVASFLHMTPGLDKQVLGDYFGEPDPFNVAVLQCFTKKFDFTDMLLDFALRKYLRAFRLPTEAQKIGRVLEAFASRYYEQCPQGFAHEDAVSALSHSVLMLNTDLHSEQVGKKTTEEEFILSNPKVNAGKDLPRDTLSKLYHSIAQHDIRMSSESLAAESGMTRNRWVDLLRRSESSLPFLSCDPTKPLLDHDMFSVIWAPSIAAISAVFDHADDEDTLRQCMDAFLAVAKISAAHHMEDVLDNLVVSLCKFTTLNEKAATPSGENTKAHMAASVAAEICKQYGDRVRRGPRSVLEALISKCSKMGLLPKGAEPSENGQERSDDSPEGSSIHADDAAAAAVDTQAGAALRTREGASETERNKQQGCAEAQRGLAVSAQQQLPLKAGVTHPLNPNTQEFVPPSKSASGQHSLPASKPSNAASEEAKARTEAQTRPAVENSEPRPKSVLRVTAPSWQPPAKLPTSIAIGFASGGSQCPVSRSSSGPKSGDRKQDTNWDVQLPDGFVETAVSPTGASDTNLEERDGENGRTESGEAANGVSGLGRGCDKLPTDLNGTSPDSSMVQLDEVLNTEPGFELIPDDEENGGVKKPVGDNRDGGAPRLPSPDVFADGADFVKTKGPNGVPSEQKSEDLVGNGDDFAEQSRGKANGRNGGASTAVEAGKSNRKPVELAPAWRREAKSTEPLEWRKRQPVQPVQSRWREARYWDERPAVRNGAREDPRPGSAISNNWGPKGGGLIGLSTALLIAPVRPEDPKQPRKAEVEEPAGKAPRTPSSGVQVPKAPSSEEGSVPVKAEGAEMSVRVRPVTAGTSAPPGFSKPPPEALSPCLSEPLPLPVASLQPTSSSWEAVPDSETPPSSSRGAMATSKPVLPSRLVLSRVLVKQTVLEEGLEPMLHPPAEPSDVLEAEVHIEKRPPVELQPLGEFSSAPKGRLQDWLGRLVEVSNGPDGFVEAMPAGSDDAFRPASSSSSAGNRGVAREGPASTTVPEADTWRMREGGLQEHQSRRPHSVQSDEGGIAHRYREEMRPAVSPPPAPAVMHPHEVPHEVLRRLLPQGTNESTTFPPFPPNSGVPRQVTQLPPLAPPQLFAPFNPEPASNGGPPSHWAGNAHGAQQDPYPRPQSYPHEPQQGQMRGALERQHYLGADQNPSPWSSTNNNLNPQPDSFPPQPPSHPIPHPQSGWPGEARRADAFRTAQPTYGHGGSAHAPHRYPPQNHPFPTANPWQREAGLAPPPQANHAQEPPLSALQHAPHIRQLQATVQEHFQRSGGLKSPEEQTRPNSQPTEFPPFGCTYPQHPGLERSGSGGGNDERGPSPTGWVEGGLPDYHTQAQFPPHYQEELAYQGSELRQNHSGGYENVVGQAPLPESLGPVGSLLPRERMPSQNASLHYDHPTLQAQQPLLDPGSSFESHREAAQAHVRSPEYPHSRPSVSPESYTTEHSPRGETAGPRASDRKGAYNPMQWVAPKTKEDSVSDADLQRLLSENGVLDASEEGPGEQVGTGPWSEPSGEHAHWQHMGIANNGPDRNRNDFEHLKGSTSLAQAGASARVRTAAQIVAAGFRPDEEQFEADTKAAMNVSLEEYKSQAATGHPRAQVSSWPAVPSAVPPKPAVGKGLANKTGEYNCFLNVIIQSLWHLLPFRRSILFQPIPKRQLADAQPRGRHQAVLGGLKSIFRALSNDDGKPTAVDPSALRTALHNAHEGSDLFQIEEMNDASEVLLSIFTCLHEALHASSGAPPPPKRGNGLLRTPPDNAHQRNKAKAFSKDNDVCRGSCFIHDLFGLDMVEFTHCTHCRKRTHELRYQQFFHLVNCSALSDVAVQYPGLPFVPLLRRVLDGSQPLRPCDKDEGGCGEPLPTTHVLHQAPQLFTVVLVWGSAEASQSQVRSVVNAISTQISMAEIFPNLEQRGQHTLRCVVCYYGLHYFAFAFSSKAQQWLLLDDTHVKVVGSWEKVVEQCTNGRLQPSVLFYQSQ